MKYNHFELKINPANLVQWSEGGGFQPIDIYIDGRFLIDIVREVEETLFAQEYSGDALTSKGDFDEDLISAGDYLSLPESLTFLPSRNLLGGEPYNWFVQEPNEIHWGKSVLLGCTCGIEGCWDLVAQITLTETTVVWSRIGQFHRDDEYDLGPFVFEPQQYEAQLMKPKKACFDQENRKQICKFDDNCFRELWK